jgi:cell division protein ZapE
MAGELKKDPAQERAVAALDRLGAELKAAGGSLLRKVFRQSPSLLAGVYLWGGVGRGKSMLMDLAFAHVDVEPKRRVHFHEFMLETHARLRRIRERNAPA